MVKSARYFLAGIGILILSLTLALNTEISDAAGSRPDLSVDLKAVLHPISSEIYGLNFASPELAADLYLPVNRWGGNATTRYNWQNDTSNRASDWFFENIRNPNDHPEDLPTGSGSDQFTGSNQADGVDTLLTVPLIGWTPKSREFGCSFRVSTFGLQQSTDPWQPDCGNGLGTDGTPITGNDPLDTSQAIDPSFVQAWIAHLGEQFGFAEQGGVIFYNLDNEPMLWNYTHRDVHPEPLGYDELRDRSYQYASAIKSADPGAKTLGPVVWGWTAYFYSALDQAGGGAWWLNPPDRNAHGGVALVPWYLQQMQDYESENGVRILDYLDLHYYPQAPGVGLQPAGDDKTQARRLRTTRSLWDPTYSDESWIGEPVRLIPRMREWVDENYPGTRLAITEYNFGGLEHINGALAQADVLGIFGREGLDLATLWSPPGFDQPGTFAFRMFLNYDGKGGAFGDLALEANSDDPAQLAIYAARHTVGSSVTIIVINKSGKALDSRVTISGLDKPVMADVYRYSPENLRAIVPQADQAVGITGFDAKFPADSISLFVLPKQGEITPKNERLHLPLILK